MGCCTKFIVLLLPIIVGYWLFTGKTFNPEEIRGKRVLVTGASSGIGKQIAFKYAALGAKLIITARRKELLDEVEKKCKELGAEFVRAIPADMAKPADRKTVVDETKKQLGGLDIIILNHALIHVEWLTNTPEDVKITEKSMNVNFHSFVDITNQLLDELQKSNGYIGIVSSVAGKLGSVRLAAYAASKHALQGFFSSLRQELRAKNSGVSVTLVVYGPVATEQAMEMSEKSGKDVSSMMKYIGSSEDAADALVQGVAARNYEVYFPAIGTVFVYLNRIMPAYLEDTASSLMADM
ncbi:hypothetical protein CHUAL_012998 [Chamberlinius hualienensis]